MTSHLYATNAFSYAAGMDPAFVLNVVGGMLSPDNATRRQAELTFAQLCSQPGLGSALITIVAKTDLEENMRQSAGVFLKKLIQENWSCDEEEEVDEQVESNVVATLYSEHEEYERVLKAALANQIEIPEADKATIRAQLPSLLGDVLPSIRMSASVCIATIATYEYPDLWPDLLPGLVQTISSLANMRMVQGALKCLSIFIEDVIDDKVTQILTTLFPALLHIISARDSNAQFTYTTSIRADALQLFSSFIHTFTLLEDPGAKSFERTFQGSILPVLPKLLSLCCELITAPYPTAASVPAALQHFLPVVVAAHSREAAMPAIQNAFMFSVRAAAIGLLTKLIAFFPKLMKAHVPALLTAVEGGFIAAVPYYTATVVSPVAPAALQTALAATGQTDLFAALTSVYNVCVDESSEDSPACGLSLLMEESVQLFTTLADHSTTLGKCLRLRLPVLSEHIAALLLLSEKDVDEFEMDINQFAVSEEEGDFESFSSSGGVDASGTGMIRKQANVLVATLLERWPVTGAESVASAAMALYAAAEQRKGSGQESWWKYREAAILTIGTLLFNTKAFGKQKTLSLDSIFTDLLPIALASQCGAEAAVGDNNDFLAARGAWLLAPLVQTYTAQLSAQAQASSPAMEDTYNKLTHLTSRIATCLAPSAATAVRLSAVRSLRVCGMSLIAIDSLVLTHRANAALAAAGLPPVDHDAPAPPTTGAHAPNSIPVSYVSCMHAHVGAYMAGLCALLKETDGEGLVCVLESLSWLINHANNWYDTVADLASAAPALQLFSSEHVLQPHLGGVVTEVANYAHVLAEHIIGCWARNTNDHNIAEVVVDCIKGLCSLRAAHDKITAVVVPVVLSLLSTKAQNDDSSIKVVAMGMLSILMRTAAPGPFSVSLVSMRPLFEHYANTITDVATAVTYAGLSGQPNPTVPALARLSCSFSAVADAQPLPATEVVDKMLPLALLIGREYNEKTLTQGAAAISATILAIYSVHVKQNMAAYQPLLTQCLELSLKLLRNNDNKPDENDNLYTDMDAVFAVRLLSQLLVHFGATLPAQTYRDLVYELSHKLVATSCHSLQVAILITLARLALPSPTTFLSGLAGMGTVDVKTVEVKKAKKNKKTGKWTKGSETVTTKSHQLLAAVLNLWCQRFDDMHSPYPIRLLTALFAAVLSDTSACTLLQGVTVEDVLVVDSSSGVQTRRAKGSAGSYTQVNVLVKMLSLLSLAGKRAVDAKNKEEGEYEEDLLDVDDSDGLSEDEQELDQEDKKQNKLRLKQRKNEEKMVREHDMALLGKGAGKESIFADAGDFDMAQLSDLLDIQELGGGDDEYYDQGADAQDYPECAYDVLNAVDIAALVGQFVASAPVDMLQAMGPQMAADAQEALRALMQMVGK